MPRLALTLGDVAGIGPEVVAHALRDAELRSRCRFIVVGSPDVMRRAAPDLDFREVRDPADIPASMNTFACWNPTSVATEDVPLGKLDARAGRAAYDWLVAATRAALAGTIDGIVTAPLNKAALHLAGLDFPGHTEILAHECGAARHAMMLYLGPGGMIQSPQGLAVAHVTLHTSIASVPGLLTTDRIHDTIALIDGFLKRIGIAQPRIGVCALNPHAGEEGLFGDEEGRLIAPAVARAQAEGVLASGPFPADTLVRRAVLGEFDGIAAMYHEQGHIPFKLLGFDRAVNVTLGLPIVRTSPSHGTAFDIAGQGIARGDGMRTAIDVALRLIGGS